MNKNHYFYIYHFLFILVILNVSFVDSYFQDVTRSNLTFGSYQTLKASWDTISVPNFEPQSYPIFANNTNTCVANNPCLFLSCIFTLDSVSGYNYQTCPSSNFIFPTGITINPPAGASINTFYFYGAVNVTNLSIVSAMVQQTSSSVYSITNVSIPLLKFGPETLPNSDPAMSFEHTIFVYDGSKFEVLLPKPNFVSGSALSSSSIEYTYSFILSDFPTANYTLYSESFPNGMAVVGEVIIDISAKTFSWPPNGNPSLNVQKDQHVYLTMDTKSFFGLSPGTPNPSIYISNGGILKLENVFITGFGRTSNQPYDSVNNQRGRSPIYAEFTGLVSIKNCFIASFNQRADIIAHHSIVSVSGTAFAGNSGSSILGEWGTERIVSENNVFIKAMPNISQLNYTLENMDFGYQGNAIYSVSPFVVSTNDFIYFSTPQLSGIVINILNNRWNLTGYFLDYSLHLNQYYYSNATNNYVISISGTQVIGDSQSPISITSAELYSPIILTLSPTLQGVDKIIINTPGVLLIKDSILNQLPYNIEGSFNTLIFQNSKIINIPASFFASAQYNSVKYINSIVYSSSPSYPNKDNRFYLPVIIPSNPNITIPITIAPTIPTIPHQMYENEELQMNFNLISPLYCRVLVNTLLYQEYQQPCQFTFHPNQTGSIEMTVEIYSVANGLELIINIPEFKVIPHSNRYYQGYAFTLDLWTENNLNISVNNQTEEQMWSKCTDFFQCTISDSILPVLIPFNTSNESSTIFPIGSEDYLDFFKSGINTPTPISFTTGKVTYYEISFFFVYLNEFTSFSQAQIPNAPVLSLMVNGENVYQPISLISNQATFLNLTYTIASTSENQTIILTWDAPECVYLTSFLISSDVQPFSYWVALPPVITDEPVGPGDNGLNLIAVIIPIVVGVVVIGAIVAFILYRRKKSQQTIKPPISPLKMSHGSSQLKMSRTDLGALNQSAGKLPLVPQHSSRNLLTSSGSGFKTTTVSEDKYHVDADILTFVQESHFYGWDHPDFPISFSNTKLDFGMGGMKSPIDTELQDSLILINKSKKPINVTILLPVCTSAALVDTEASNIVIKPGKTHQVFVSVTLLCTTKYMEKFAIHVEDFGHTFLFIHLESVLSTKLDFNELEFFQPPVGEGSFGVVYRGMWRGQEVAIKQMKVSSVNMDEVYREMDLMSKLRHPNIISFIGAVMSSDNLCIVSEFVPLGSLGDILYKGNKKLSMAQKIRVALDIAKGCNFLHQCGIIHRDLKPDNILVVSLAVDAPITIKISDFGTSKEAAELDYSKFTNAVGTPIYMSNQILEKKDYDNATDVYSYAIMFYEIIIEEVPFSEIKNMWDIPRFVISGKRPTKGLDQVDPAIVAIINECWSHDATLRPSFKDVIPRLEFILEGLLKLTKSNKKNNNNNNDDDNNSDNDDNV